MVVEDLSKIFKSYHNKNMTMSISITEYDLNVVFTYLEADEDRNDDSITITYDSTLLQCSYLNHKDYVENFDPEEYGLYLEEISLIHDIMKYLDEHREDVEALCDSMSAEDECKDADQ